AARRTAPSWAGSNIMPKPPRATAITAARSRLAPSRRTALRSLMTRLPHRLGLLDLYPQGTGQIASHDLELLLLAHVLDRHHAAGFLILTQHHHETDTRAIRVLQLLAELLGFQLYFGVDARCAQQAGQFQALRQTGLIQLRNHDLDGTRGG